MVYINYNLKLWVRQLQKKSNVEAISLDGIDTTATWRDGAKKHVMESSPDWLQEEA
jgi:hypothetical protein